MFRLPFVLAIAIAAVASSAERPDPTKSPECLCALDRLNAIEEEVAAARSSAPLKESYNAKASTRLNATRKNASRICLGGSGDPPPLARPAALPTDLAPPLTTSPGLRPQASPSSVVVPNFKRVEQPVSVTSCDPGGCWASDGTRLQRVGPNLLGPQGFCTTQGALVHCP